jgi:sulfate transport system substrate-binding protein
MVTRSVVVIGVRKGNPKGIRDWTDLARKGVEVLTPDVRTSGGAMWNVAAIYGAALRAGSGSGTGAGSVHDGGKAAAAKLLADVLANVEILDKGARESLLNFERGVGDAIVTYENEILVGRMKGKDYEYVIPKSTILIENPIALVDANTDKHGSRKLAEAFLAFLHTPEAQRGFAEYGLRPVSAAVASELGARFPAVGDQFTIADLGGWERVQKELFAKGAVYDQALEAARGAAQ